MDDAPIPPGPQQHGAESNGSNRHPNLYIRRFVDFAMQPELHQPMERDLEAAAAAAVAAPADAAPVAPADAGSALEARLEQLMPLLKDAGNALPFFVLLLIQFASFHFVGICALLWFALLQHRMNANLKVAALQSSSVQPCSLLARLGILFGSNVLLAEFLLASDGVWRCWWRIPFVGGAPTLPTVLWLIVHNQYLLVFTCAAAKALFLCAVSSVWNERRIKEGLGFIESFCGAWLQLLPVLLWMRYLSDDRFVHSIQPFVIIYVSMKLRVCKHYFSRLRSSFLAVVMRRCPFGQYVPVSECGDRECAICLEGLTVPLKLPCDHIFCEACLMSWMQREATCPCCRAVVPGADGGGVPTNDGSSSLVPQIF